MSKKSSQTGIDEVASVPVTVEPEKANAPAEPQVADKPQATRKFRGRECPIVRSFRDLLTGVEYDLVQYGHKVRDKANNTTKTVYLTRRLRRPGTGNVAPRQEEDIATEIEVD